MTMEDVGASLYASAQPVAAPQPAPVPEPGALPVPAPVDDPEIAALRSGVTLYDGAARQGFPDSLVDQMVATGVDKQEAAAFVAEGRRWALDLQLERHEIKDMLEAVTRADAVRQKGDVEAVRTQVADTLRRHHGDQAPVALQAARAYVAKVPSLAAWLDRTGVGDDPYVVSTLAGRALALHKAGRLTIPKGTR
jgi:hypothetical protein